MDRSLTQSKYEKSFPYLALLPAVALILLVGILPNVYTFYLSLHKYELINPPPVFIGFENYLNLIVDNPRFLHAIIFTVAFAFIATCLELFLGFGIAYLLADEDIGHRYASVIRTQLMLPFVAAPVVVSYIFKTQIYDPTFGYLNYFLSLLKLPTFNMFEGAMRAPIAILVMEVILRTPFVVIILYAGISSIDPAILDAGKIDGASGWQNVTKIILPTIAQVAVVAYVLRFIDALKMFDEIYVITGGGPGFATENISLYAVSQAFVYFHMGFASAAAFLFLLLIIIMVSGFMRFFKL
jgi:multiple sugar transport system permease protein